ncbi:hypothetical protein D1007_06484 [Hordeum vulgare]|nr:hypothetical protein D1007_06484 [Hordeum vulgare]
MATPAVPLHIHALLSGVLPPFLSFLIAVLFHYHIHALHLDPSSLVILSAFAFLCEDFVGVTPSVALLRHFFSLELVSEEECSGCASLKTADAFVPGALVAKLLPKQRGSDGSGCRSKLPRPRDPMRIQVLLLSPEVLHELLRWLCGGDPDELPRDGLPLYNFKAPEALVTEMPLFDEWGFLPGGGASTLGVQALENSGHAAPAIVGEGGVMPPAPPALAPGRVGVGGDDSSTVEVAEPPASSGRGGRLREAAPRCGGLR